MNKEKVKYVFDILLILIGGIFGASMLFDLLIIDSSLSVPISLLYTIGKATIISVFIVNVIQIYDKIRIPKRRLKDV